MGNIGKDCVQMRWAHSEATNMQQGQSYFADHEKQKENDLAASVV